MGGALGLLGAACEPPAPAADLSIRTGAMIAGTSITTQVSPVQVVKISNADNATQICTGALITNQWVLTSRQCVDKVTANLSVLLPGPTSQSAIAYHEKAVTHPAVAYDLALLLLDRPFVVDGSTEGFYAPIYAGTTQDLQGRAIDFYGISTFNFSKATGTVAHGYSPTFNLDLGYQFQGPSNVRLLPEDTGGPSYVLGPDGVTPMLTGIHWFHYPTQTVFVDTSLASNSNDLGWPSAREWIAIRTSQLVDVPYNATANGAPDFAGGSCVNWIVAKTLTASTANQLTAYSMGTDRKLWKETFDESANGFGAAAGAWKPGWTSVPGPAALSAPRGISAGTMNVWVPSFVRVQGGGTLPGQTLPETHIVARNSGKLYDTHHTHTDAANEAFSAWAAVPPPPSGAGTDPALTSRSNGPLNLFVVGNDSGLYRTSYNYNPATGAGAWSSSWTALGGICASAPAAASAPDGSLAAAVIGSDNNSVWLWTGHDGGAWWGNLGGYFPPPITLSVTTWSMNHIDVFARDAIGDLHQLTYHNGQFGPWLKISSKVDREPKAFSRKPGQIDLVMVTDTGASNGCLSDNAFHHVQIPTRFTVAPPAGTNPNISMAPIATPAPWDCISPWPSVEAFPCYSPSRDRIFHPTNQYGQVDIRFLEALADANAYQGENGDAARRLIQTAYDQLTRLGVTVWGSVGLCDPVGTGFYAGGVENWCSEFVAWMYRTSGQANVGGIFDAANVSEMMDAFVPRMWPRWFMAPTLGMPNAGHTGDYLAMMNSEDHHQAHSGIILAISDDNRTVWSIQGNVTGNEGHCVRFSADNWFTNLGLNPRLDGIGEFEVIAQ